MNPDPNDKVIVCTVEEAVALGADAVSIHINLGAPNESRMLESAGEVVRDCNRWGMPLLIMIYPRGTGIDPTSPQSVGHCVRVAEELGADLIKTNYTGDPETFRRITAACSVPVMIAGGEKGGDMETLTTIRGAIDAGAAGVCMGRNAFQRGDRPGSSGRSAGWCTREQARPMRWRRSDEAVLGRYQAVEEGSRDDCA